ncbi:hypothetical protein [Saccharothrix sp. HUAS TT1]|uniref:hypothetical protein n=1 Tax=unclassified Saccharothrix TaxID=2593673 RepID=UPI00345B7C67
MRHPRPLRGSGPTAATRARVDAASVEAATAFYDHASGLVVVRGPDGEVELGRLDTRPTFMGGQLCPRVVEEFLVLFGWTVSRLSDGLGWTPAGTRWTTPVMRRPVPEGQGDLLDAWSARHLHRLLTPLGIRHDRDVTTIRVFDDVAAFVRWGVDGVVGDDTTLEFEDPDGRVAAVVRHATVRAGRASPVVVGGQRGWATVADVLAQLPGGWVAVPGAQTDR